MSLRERVRALPIRSKLTLLLLVPCVVVLVLLGAVVFWFQMFTFRQGFEHNLVSVSAIAADGVVAPLKSQDRAETLKRLEVLIAKTPAKAVAVLTPDRRVFASQGQSDRFPGLLHTVSEGAVVLSDGEMWVRQPVMSGGGQIATLFLVADYQTASRKIAGMVAGIVGVVAVVAVALVFSLANRLQRLVSDPVLHLADTARRVAEANDYSVRAVEMTGSELGLLTRTFNQMLAQIQKQDAALQQASRDLARQVDKLQREVEERHRVEQRSQELHNELVTASRQAGMAEVATDVLHNVGNVLNSLNVSTELINDRLANMRSDGVARVAELLRQHPDDLGAFLTQDPKGRLVPEFLGNLGSHLDEERAEVAREMSQLTRNVGHIKEIIEMQQSYARMLGMVEDLPVDELVEDAVSLNSGAFLRHRVVVQRDFQPVPRVRVDKHKVLQILVNLLRNAKYALDETNQPDRVISIQVRPGPPGRVQVLVRDNGAGIPAENLTRIFQHGFTTRRNGHGFGLHSGALAAREMGGKLSAASDGPGRGATFTLELPAAPIRGENHATAN